MDIIVGLGNPGEKYKFTRHNVGFLAIDALAEKLNLIWRASKKTKALIAKGQDIILIKPQTYMNSSGQAVRAILSYYKLLPKKFGLIKFKNSDLSKFLTIIHDDIDIKLGKYKISTNSRSAGHKGVQSVIKHLKTKNFKRLRIGIRPEKANIISVEKFVLSKFNKKEIKTINKVIKNSMPITV